MNTKNKNTDKVKNIVSSMIEIYNLLKSRGLRDPSGKELGFLHWKNFPMDTEQKRARESMDNVLEIIKTHNPQISELSIYECLLFDFTQKAIWFPGDYPNIELEYQKITSHLLKYKAKREIDIPIVNLDIHRDATKFGLVSFFKIEETDKQGQWWDTIKSTAGEYLIENVYSFARLQCPGDAIKALEYGIDVITETLNILRAVGFPLRFEPNLHFGLVNEYQLYKTRPYRLGLPHENYKLNYQPQIVRRVGPGVAKCELDKDLLDKIEATALNRLQALIESDLGNPRSEIKRKAFLGLHWLGEATKPDTTEARFAKLAFSLEALIGGDAEDKKGVLSTRGITSTLAERSAFLAGTNKLERDEIHEKIYEFYGIRSGIVHGGKKNITEDQLVDFALLIRKIFWATLTKIDIFKDVKDLQKWVLEQRYS